MKIILLNAPGGSHYEGPMMGLPAIMGQLRRAGHDHACQRDLDLELFYYTLEPKTLQTVMASLKDGQNRSVSTGGVLKKVFVRIFGRPALWCLARLGLRDRSYLEAFRSKTPRDRQFPEPGLLRYKKGVNRVLKLMAIYFYPYLSYPRFFSLLEKKIFLQINLRIANALAESFQHGQRALRGFYKTRVIPHLRDEGYDAIGISVSFKRQLEPALVLARMLKESEIEAKVIIGGSFITTTIDSDWFEESLLEHSDYVICCEGELALPALLDRLEKGQPLEDVPNLIYLEDGKQKENKRVSVLDMDQLATPDYGGLPLDQYLERPVRLPLMTCRGCYWGKCTYCSHHWTLGSGRLRARSSKKLFEDIQTFKDAYGVRSIYFTDESIHPSTMEALAKQVADAKLDIRWVGMLRFDECVDLAFLKLMRTSGCHAIMFGLESVSENVQKIINKGIHLDRAHRILNDCKALGIKVHIFIILGIPGERVEDMEANLDFLLKNPDLYETVQLAPFQLMKGSPMHRNPSKYGIYNIQTLSGAGRAAYNQILFETEMGMTRSQVERYVSAVIKNKTLFRKDLWEGFGYKLYREDT